MNFSKNGGFCTATVQCTPCPKNILYLCIKTEPVTVVADATVYILYCTLYSFWARYTSMRPTAVNSLHTDASVPVMTGLVVLQLFL